MPNIEFFAALLLYLQLNVKYYAFGVKDEGYYNSL